MTTQSEEKKEEPVRFLSLKAFVTDGELSKEPLCFLCGGDFDVSYTEIQRRIGCSGSKILLHEMCYEVVRDLIMGLVEDWFYYILFDGGLSDFIRAYEKGGYKETTPVKGVILKKLK